jgi:hypothetical protein
MTNLLPRAALLSALLLLTLFCVHSAAAQFADKGTYSRREILAASPISSDSARTSCVMLGTARWSPDVLQPGRCHARGCSVAGSTPKNGWAACEYEHDWIDPASPTQSADTLREVEVVLYRTAPTESGSMQSGRVTQNFVPVWQEIYEPEFFASVSPSVTSEPGGSLLLAIRECVNGTAGCEQSFLVNRGTSWRPVKLTFLDSVKRRYPGAIRSSFRVDPRNLSAEVWLYSDADANCCPSRSVVVSLRLRGDALVAKTIRLPRDES